MADRLAGKVALITGAASGLGAATAERFAAEGATVVGVDLQGADLRADVTDETLIGAAVATVLDGTGGSTSYANAGVPSGGRVHETSVAEWQRVLDVNLTGVFLTARAVLPGMLAARVRSCCRRASAA